jgi:methyl-accepting chemotaxis protein
MPAASATAPNRLSRVVFWPVYFFIEKVKFARSLLLLLLLLPDGYVAYLLVNQTTDSVEFSRKESAGVAYITPARALLATLQRLRVVGYAGDAAAKGEVGQLTAKADEYVAEVEKAEKQYGAELKTGVAWKGIVESWTRLKAATYPTAQERDAAFVDLTGRIAGELIVNQAGNNSNLILDPDLDSYWMMDAFVFKLPTLGELVATAATGGLDAIADGTITNEERLSLAAVSGLIATTTGDLINVDLKNALEDNEKYNEGRMGNGRLRPNLDGRFKATAVSLRAFTDALRDEVLLPTHPAMKPGDLSQMAAKLIDEVQLLQLAVRPELDLLCVERADRFRQTRLTGIITFILAALLISYVFNGFTSSVTSSQARIVAENSQLQRDILGLLQVVSNAADGDLTARAKVTQGTLGNIADAFNQMMESWQKLVGAIMHQLDRTNHAVAELRQAAGAMAKGASRQTHEVLGATSSVQRMSEEINRVSGNAENAAAAAKRTQESALQGSSSVQNVVLGMDTLRSLVQAGAKKIKTLGDRSMEITSIVGAITKISEQTNMLALNAAIEAARAGDQGRGFSVVADEVRKLAERTALATQEIDKLVKTIQTETTESVHAIERQTQVVEDEGRAVATAGTALSRIQDVSSQSSVLVTDIATIARTQVADAQTVVGTMQRISTIARETENSAQGSLNIAQGLGELSEQLRGSIGRFKVR